MSQTPTVLFGARPAPVLDAPDTVLRPPRPLDPLLAPPPPLGVPRMPGGGSLADHCEVTAPVYPVCPPVPEAPTNQWSRDNVEPLPEGATTGPGPRTVWTDEEDRTVLRLLTSDTPPSSAAELAAEYTRDTGKARSAGAWVTHLGSLIDRARLVIHPDVLPQFRVLAAQEVGAPTPRTVGAPASETKSRSRWHTWEDDVVRFAAQAVTTPEAFLSLCAEKGSNRSPEGYVHRLSRLARALPSMPSDVASERVALLHMATLLRPLSHRGPSEAEAPAASPLTDPLPLYSPPKVSGGYVAPEEAAFVEGATDTLRSELERAGEPGVLDTSASALPTADEWRLPRAESPRTETRITMPAPGPHPDLWRMEQVRRIRDLVRAGILSQPEGDAALDRAIAALPPR